MSIAIQHEHDAIYRLDIRRLLRQKDLADAEQVLVAAITRIGPVRLLVVLNEFVGMERRGSWDHAAFFEKHGDHIARIAIIGPERWRAEMLMFAAADFREGLVEFFTEDAADEARLWLSD
jgi:hypothetical protein